MFGYIAGYESAVKMLTTTHALLCSNALCGQKPSWMTYLQSFSGHLLPQTGFIPQISCQENEEWTLYEGNKKVLSLEHASGRWLVSGSPCFIRQNPFSFPGPKKEGLYFCPKVSWVWSVCRLISQLQLGSGITLISPLAAREIATTGGKTQHRSGSEACFPASLH